MLKTILLRHKLDEKNKLLAQLREKKTSFKKREDEIVAALNELDENSSDEDRKVVEDDAEKLDIEQQENDNQISITNTEINDIQSELRQLEEKQERSKNSNNDNNGRKETRNMSRVKFFGMNYEERQAFFADEGVKNFISRVRTCITEKRAIENVGLTIPKVMLDIITEKIEDNSKLLSRVYNRPVSGRGRELIMGEIPEAIWTDVYAILNEMDLGFNEIEVDGYQVAGFFAVANADANDNDVDLLTKIITAISRAIGKAVDKAIIYGTGVRMPLGWVTRLAQTAEPSDYLATARPWKNLSATNILTGTGATGSTLFQEIVKRSGIIDNDYITDGLIWCMNKKTHTTLMAEAMGKDMNAAIVAGMQNEMPIIGGEIIELSFIPEGDITFGYAGAYLLAEREGTVLSQSEHVRWLRNQTLFKGVARYDGLPIIPEAFGLISISTNPPTTSVEFAPDKANTETKTETETEGTNN
ncbi:MAG: phage major capsid protein [Eubacterium sp.]